jgi:hypothetical protein
MKSTFDVLDKIYPVVNVASVRSTLNTGGKVYRNARPVNSDYRDIVVLVLPIACGTDIDLQSCVIIINCFAKDIEPGIPDDKNLDAMTTAVLTVLEAYASTTTYFDMEITSQGVMEDMDKPDTSYSSIRVNCTIQYET